MLIIVHYGINALVNIMQNLIILKEIIFENEEIEEEFYQKYGLEPDEQPFETQEKTLKQINQINLIDWCKEKYESNICDYEIFLNHNQ